MVAFRLLKFNEGARISTTRKGKITMNKNELLTELSLPFAPSEIQWKPGNAKGDRCLAMPFADVRAYQDRLDAVCGLDWHIEYQPWGEGRIIARLTIAGTTRASTGEMNAQDEKNGMGGTVAEAQALKRAAAQFGLGRYLYDLPSVWVTYDAQARKISREGQNELETRYKSWYSKRIAQLAAGTETAQNRPQTPATVTNDLESTETQPQAHIFGGESDFEPSDNPKSDDAPASAESADKLLSRAQLTRLNVLGVELYGTNKAWNAKRPALVLAASNGAVESSKQLTPAQADLLIAGLHKRVEQKRAEEAQKRSERTAQTRLSAHHQAALNGSAGQ